MKNLYLPIFIAVLCLSQLASAAGSSGSATKKAAPAKARPRVETAHVKESYSSNGWASHYGPWDFSGLLAFNTPGIGFQALAAYRIVDHLVEDLDDTLSIESGIGYLSASDTYFNTTYTYTYFEIPIMARWDIHIRDSKFTLSPRAGFYYLTGGTTTVNGVSVTTRGGSLYVQLGGAAFFHLSDEWALRADLAVGGFTNISFGATYFL